MTDTELTAAFDAALLKYNQTHPFVNVPLNIARYFFFAGSEFGCNAAAEIYSGARQVADDDIEGVAV